MNCIAPVGLGSPTVQEQQLGEPGNLLVPGLRHPVLLWAVGVAEGTMHPLSPEVRKQDTVEELPPPVRVELLELPPHLPFCCHLPLDDPVLSLVLGVQRNRPAESGMVIHQCEPVFVPLETERKRAH